MEKNSNNPLKIIQGKDKYFLSQKKIVYKYLLENTATASMVSVATGISQKNICRYKRTLEKNNRLWVVEKKMCRLTGFQASYLTTNPDVVASTQLQLNVE